MNDQEHPLVKAYPDFLRLATKILKNRWYAQDIVQDAIIVTLTTSGVQDLVSYCLGVIWKKSCALSRSKKYSPLPEPEDMPWFSTNLNTRDTEQEVQYVLSQLSPELRQILNLKYIEKLPGNSIAKTCNITRPTIYRRLRRAEHRFKSELQALSLY